MKEESKKTSKTPEKKVPVQPDKDINDETYDKTVEDSFPASDPPSSIPDPHEDKDAA